MCALFLLPFSSFVYGASLTETYLFDNLVGYNSGVSISGSVYSFDGSFGVLKFASPLVNLSKDSIVVDFSSYSDFDTLTRVDFSLSTSFDDAFRGVSGVSVYGSDSDRVYSFPVADISNDVSYYLTVRGFYTGTLNLDFSQISIKVNGAEILSSSPSLIPFTNNNISVPAGYMLAVDRYLISSLDTSLPDKVIINAEFPNLARNHSNNVTYGFTDSLPSGNVLGVGNSISWLRPANASTNWLGASYSAGAFVEGYNLSPSRYFYIINPAWSYNADNKVIVNPTLNVSFANQNDTYTSTFSGFSGWYKLVPLDSNGVSSSSTTDVEFHWGGTENIEGDGYTSQGWQDSENNYVTPSVGGANNVISSSDSSESLVDMFGDIVDRSNRQSSNLISRGHLFFEKLGEFFSFLPSEIFAIIVPCIAIFFVVAVVKLFL